MKKINKKGFTMIELVIVIAVVAVLAGVLIPTFSTLVHKANVSADTQLAKNLNTALATYEAINGEVENFSEVLNAAREAGYIISQLNPTAEGCYFVWESDTNQILLVDSKDDYSVIYSIEEPKEIGPTWHFATSDKKAAAALREDSTINGANVQDMVASVDDFMAALEEGGTQTLYIDDSVVLEEGKNILLNNVDTNITLELGNSTISTQETLASAPVTVNAGKLTINGGNIGGAGEHTNENGTFKTTVQVGANNTEERITLNLKDVNIVNNIETTIRAYRCDLTLDNVTLNAKNQCVYIANGSQATLTNVTATSTDNQAVLIASHYSATGTIDKQTKMTVVSGTYTNVRSEPADDQKDSVIWVTNGAEFVIKGGTFESKVGEIINLTKGKVTITGGTFITSNGTYKFADLTTVEAWKALCNTDVNVEGVGTGMVTISKN